MKECFKEHAFGVDAIRVVAACNRVIEEYLEQGYDLSLRQLYYQMIANDLLPDEWIDAAYNRKHGLPPDTKNTERSYKRLGDLVGTARLAGEMDWDAIADRGRETVAHPHWRNPGEILAVAAKQFRLDRWADQPVHVEVMCEKDALSGVFEPVCRGLDVPFTANRGYSSLSFLYRKGKELAEHVARGKVVKVFYFGDHDPSGLDMDRDLAERLNLFAWSEDAGWDLKKDWPIEVQRVALTWAQVQQFRPPPNPAKVTDSRADKYIDRYGDESWELDAIEPATLADLVRDVICRDNVRDEKLLRATLRREAKMVKRLHETAKAWKE